MARRLSRGLLGEDEASDDAMPVSAHVVTLVADLTESDPCDLDPLYNAVDPDALDRLFPTDEPALDRFPDAVSFTYAGCEITISGDGTITARAGEQERTQTWV